MTEAHRFQRSSDHDGLEQEKQNIREIIAREFKPRLIRTRSSRLGENGYMDDANQKHYERALAPHQIRWTEVRAYEQRNAAKKKEDLLFEDDPNIGWKLHLNVEPVFVKLVSDYLRGNGYVHKYLSGGEIQDGKVFTLYIGSYALAQRCAHAISEILTPLLCLSKPGDNQEIEFAAGIVGRFTGEKKQGFDAYGSCGFSLLRVIPEFATNQGGFFIENIE